ncbi:MAG TPA: hypothetical protein IAC81_05595 [Candidatus Scatomorpha stercorigallinarum]|nr:hypothetical protein [Candidatus Scatomorpha stercorigallinarum]
MADNMSGEVRTWLDALRGLDVRAKKMFGCYCLYCDGQAVGWISGGALSLREAGLDYIPPDIRRPAPGDRIQEYVVPLDYASAEWLPRAVQDTARLRAQAQDAGTKAPAAQY